MDDFAQQKLAAARAARLEPFKTIVDESASCGLEEIGTPRTRELLDGPFYQSPLRGGTNPAFNLVFVQSRDGNTGAADPSTLGGGETDKHLLYEGLSRASADAVMAGAGTIRDGGAIFSVWHPEIVSLRAALGKPRHPAQVVVSGSGELPVEAALLFNVPEIAVVILTTDAAAPRLAKATRGRPWISVVSSGAEADLSAYAAALRRDFGISRVSAIGGRTLATSLIDAGLVSDLYLTTGPEPGGAPGTPMYAAGEMPGRTLAVRKRNANGVLFEHFTLPSR